MANKQNISLETERLLLRFPQLKDASDIQRLAGAWEVAETTSTIPHPYEDGMAEAWIQSIHERPEDDSQFTYAMIRQGDNQLVGVCGFHLNQHHKKAEIGYWVGKPYWGNGYATETTQRIIEFCFVELKLNRVQASYYTSNGASRRVMEKAGMSYEGTLRQAMLRDIPSKNHHVYHDIGYCAILRSDWETKKD